jgi:TonB-dependent SusC/RagA subfamily outer membrane receptor
MRIRHAVSIVVLGVLGACGGPGLPPAGPAPGEVDVGYDTQQAEKVTGAVSSVKPAADKSTPLRIEELLRGKAAGVQVVQRTDGSVSLRIRAAPGTDMGGTNLEPLIVVNGTPLSNGNLEEALAGLTRDDIKQVDVLKDLASTAIYGQRGAAGVIVISTTRR